MLRFFGFSRFFCLYRKEAFHGYEAGGGGGLLLRSLAAR